MGWVFLEKMAEISEKHQKAKQDYPSLVQRLIFSRNDGHCTVRKTGGWVTVNYPAKNIHQQKHFQCGWLKPPVHEKKRDWKRGWPAQSTVTTGNEHSASKNTENWKARGHRGTLPLSSIPWHEEGWACPPHLWSFEGLGDVCTLNNSENFSLIVIRVEHD